jgi:hypothetical protein
MLAATVAPLEKARQKVAVSKHQKGLWTTKESKANNFNGTLMGDEFGLKISLSVLQNARAIISRSDSEHATCNHYRANYNHNVFIALELSVFGVLPKDNRLNCLYLIYYSCPDLKKVNLTFRHRIPQLTSWVHMSKSKWNTKYVTVHDALKKGFVSISKMSTG